MHPKGVLAMLQNEEICYKGTEIVALLGTATLMTAIISLFIGL